MKVSIIIPIYNVEKYIERCLRSVFAQNYQNLECILVNDSTPDKSFLIAKELIDDYHGCIEFHLIEHEKNKGLSEARNTGVHSSHGDYMFFLDSDDTLPQNAISLLVKTAQANDNPEIVMGITKGINAKGDIIDVSTNQNLSFYNNKEVFEGYLNNKWYLIGCNKLVRKDIFTEHNTFFEPGIYHEDVLWSFEISIYINKLILCPYTTYFYFLGDSNSISRSSWSLKRINDSLFVLKKKANYLGHTANDNLLAQRIKQDGYSYIYAMSRNKYNRSIIKSHLHLIDAIFQHDLIVHAECIIPFYWKLAYFFYKYI